MSLAYYTCRCLKNTMRMGREGRGREKERRGRGKWREERRKRWDKERVREERKERGWMRGGEKKG